MGWLTSSPSLKACREHLLWSRCCAQDLWSKVPVLKELTVYGQKKAAGHSAVWSVLWHDMAMAMGVRREELDGAGLGKTVQSGRSRACTFTAPYCCLCRAPFCLPVEFLFILQGQPKPPNHNPTSVVPSEVPKQHACSPGTSSTFLGYLVHYHIAL